MVAAYCRRTKKGSSRRSRALGRAHNGLKAVGSQGRLKPGKAAILWSRKKKNPLPCKSFEPVRETMFTTPAETVPEERSKPRVLIWNSWTVSAEKFCEVPPVTRSLPREPSTEITVICCGAPPIEI